MNRSIALSEARLKQAPNDPAALFELGSALGLQASWSATVDGRVMGAFGAARRAYVVARARQDSPEGEPRAAIAVDELEGQSEVLVRGLGRHAKRWRAVGGATELLATPAIDGITVTNTVPPFRLDAAAARRLTILDTSDIIARAMMACHDAG